MSDITSIVLIRDLVSFPRDLFIFVYNKFEYSEPFLEGGYPNYNTHILQPVNRILLAVTLIIALSSCSYR
jgi:hypothetical protein